MKFSEIAEDQWGELRPYLDTCLLPVTGMTGIEQPYEATEALERLRDVMDLIEIPYKGRVVTYPALHYIDEETQATIVNRLCVSLKQSGFRYVIVISANNLAKLSCPDADITIFSQVEGENVNAATVSTLIQQMWNPSAEV